MNIASAMHRAQELFLIFLLLFLVHSAFDPIICFTSRRVGCCLLIVFTGFSELAQPSLIALPFTNVNESTKAVYTTSEL